MALTPDGREAHDIHDLSNPDTVKNVAHAFSGIPILTHEDCERNGTPHRKLIFHEPGHDPAKDTPWVIIHIPHELLGHASFQKP